jgi:hypothetical protein
LRILVFTETWWEARMTAPRTKRSIGVLFGFVMCSILAAAPASAASSTSAAQKCNAAKRAAAGRDLGCSLTCTAKAVTKGLPLEDPSVATCRAACSTKLNAAFAKAEKKGGCLPTGDATEVAADLATVLGTFEETTYSQADWGSPSNASNQLFESYDTIYAPTFGVSFVGLTSGFSMSFTDADSVEAYLPAAGPPGPLNGNVLDPITTAAGSFGGEVYALKLNVDFSDARVLGTVALPFGDLALCNVGTLPLNGTTVRQFLGIVNTLLGGGSSTFTIAGLAPITSELNSSFEGGVPGPFAQNHLVNGACVCPPPTRNCNGVCGICF